MAVRLGRRYRCRDDVGPIGVERASVMGILNATPDSFSDGGLYTDVEAAVRHGVELTLQGADIVDVGGESTRPGASRVSEREELRRVQPVISALAAAGIDVSIDTMRSTVASAAVGLGASVINDVSGGLADASMVAVVAETGVTYVVSHWRAHSDSMGRYASYGDVVAEVVEELEKRVEALVAAGVAENAIVLDPGLGFAKKPHHNWALLGHFDRLLALGRPVLVGPSRKSFLADPCVPASAPEERDRMTCAVSTLAAASGASCVRVHDAASGRDAVRAAALWACSGAAVPIAGASA